MLECQELKVVFDISGCIGELILPMKKTCLPPCFQVLFGFAKGDSGICRYDKNKPKSLKINKYTYVKLKGSRLNEYLPISSLPLLGVFAGRSLWKFAGPPFPVGSNPHLSFPWSTSLSVPL